MYSVHTYVCMYVKVFDTLSQTGSQMHVDCATVHQIVHHIGLLNTLRCVSVCVCACACGYVCVRVCVYAV